MKNTRPALQRDRHRPSNRASPGSRRRADKLDVPTFQPTDETKPDPAPAPSAEETATEEAVRRMVEAAYT